MGRILAIDYGNKRVGLAVTDPGQLIPNNLTTVPTHQLFQFLAKYFTSETVDEIIVGYPKTLNNQPSESVKYIDPFVKKLKQLYPDKEIKLYDERFTSSMALQTMIDGGMKKKQRQKKEVVDAISATILLQSYLQYKSSRRDY